MKSNLITHKLEGRDRAAKSMRRRPGSLTAAIAALVVVAVASYSIAVGAEIQADDKPAKFGIRTISTHPDRVSGGDVLVEIRVKDAKLPLLVTLNGRNISDVFHPGETPNSLLGLVTGLTLGKNRLTVTGGGLGHESLVVTNYPIKGPIVSGPHLEPFICQTEDFVLPDGTRLGPPTDEDCSAPTKINYIYASTGGGAFQPLPSTTSLPADVAMTTTLTGLTVPFVVRVETATINRGIYQHAILHDPTSEPEPTPFSPPKGWNKRLLAQHGAGCPGGWYRQGAAQGVNILAGANMTRLGEGWGIFINTLQHPSNSCNSFLAGETTMMGKEHFIETFGVPLYTLSTGGSGGAYTSEQVADAFPGLFDGIRINAVFPDALSIALSGLDGHLLTHYFSVTNPTGFTDDEKVAITGYQGIQAWIDAANQAQRTDPVPGRVDIPGYNSAVWNAAVPEELRYHPITNPSGARPTVFDVARNIYGTNPITGFALRPFDNVGVQYGLAALNGEAITTTQFLDLNENIGGYDHDANYVADRTVGNIGAIRRAYQSGVHLGGNGGLATIPVLDSGGYNDASGYHYQWFHFAARERMKEANGHADNFVMWRGSAVPQETAWQVLNDWVMAIKSDHSNIPERLKVIRNKPAEAVDGCWASATEFIAEPQTRSSQPDTQCNTLFPSYTFPRYIAGGPLAAN
jgi:hypothetical protein